MRVVLADSAVADLESIGDHIAMDSPERALRFLQLLRVRCLQLSDMTRAFPLVPRYENMAIRRRPAGDYLIFYRIEDDQIEVLHALHGARDYEAILVPAS